MKRLPRGAVVWLVVTAVLVSLHGGAGRWLAEHDPIAAVTTKFEWGTVVVVLVLMGSRLFLYFVMPGWLLCLVVGSLLARWPNPERERERERERDDPGGNIDARP